VLNRFTLANISLNSCVWVMHPRTALFLSMQRTAQDVFAFPGITVNGGTFFGFPVVTSNNVPIDTGNDTYVTLIAANEVFLADDGGVTLDISREASLEMLDSGLTQPSPSTLVSLWQNNLVGIRAEREIVWKRRRAAAVGYIDDVSY
jgi:HK97 family phage major capsid protein